MSDRCESCGHHRDWGCRFDCPDRKAPRDPSQYRVWAEIQKEHHARGEVTGEKKAPRGQ